MRVRVHQPLWGGFPTKWASGSPDYIKPVDRESDAQDYEQADAEKIAATFKSWAPNAIVKIV